MIKKFILIVCGSIVGTMIALGLVMFCAFAMSIGIMAAFGQEGGKSGVQDKSILCINLNGDIADRGEGEAMDMVGMLRGVDPKDNLADIVKALKVAKTDDRIQGVLLNCQGAQTEPATLRAVRQAVLDFKQCGKWVYSYAGEGYAQGDYYIATAADSILVNPIGAVDIHGLASVTPFYKPLLDKVGVEMQILRVGTYKSAVEPYMLDSISPANREQQTLYLGNIWQTLAADIAKSRKLQPEKLEQLTNQVVATMSTQELKAARLIDGTCYRPEFEAMLKKKVGLEPDDDLRLAAPSDLVASYDAGKSTDGEIAVLYAVGEIDGSGSGIDSEELVDCITDLTEDDNVKGLVLRVNSPGGSAYGSEQIWKALEDFKKAGKKFSVSMGGMAASGGYYISCGANKIYADSATITGSIGIFGMIPCFENLVENKLGVHTSVVKTHANADALSGGIFSKKLSPAQQAAMQNMINRGYELFTKRCADGRHVSQDSIKKIAEGRVWDGITAKKIGLVDEFGGLQQAIDFTAKAAGLKQGYYLVSEYPKVKTDYRRLLGGIMPFGMSASQAAMQQQMGDFYTLWEQSQQLLGRSHILCLANVGTIE